MSGVCLVLVINNKVGTQEVVAMTELWTGLAMMLRCSETTPTEYISEHISKYHKLDYRTRYNTYVNVPNFYRVFRQDTL